MKQLADFFPLAVFFGVYLKTSNLITATLFLVIATVIQVAYLWFRHHRIEKMHLITLAIVVPMGALTVIFKNPVFIYWKPTVLNWLLGLTLIILELFWNRNLIRQMLHSNLDLPDAVWTRVNHAWGIFFLFSGTLNIIVAYSMPEDVWVKFKVFGLLALTFVFVVAQMAYLSRYLKEDTPTDNPPTE